MDMSLDVSNDGADGATPRHRDSMQMEDDGEGEPSEMSRLSTSSKAVVQREGMSAAERPSTAEMLRENSQSRCIYHLSTNRFSSYSLAQRFMSMLSLILMLKTEMLHLTNS